MVHIWYIWHINLIAKNMPYNMDHIIWSICHVRKCSEDAIDNFDVISLGEIFTKAKFNDIKLKEIKNKLT